MDGERTRFQKIILLLLAGMIVLFGILTAVSRADQGVLFDGTVWKRTGSDSGTVYTGKLPGEGAAVITVTRDGQGATVEYASDVLHDIYRMEYPLPPVQTERGAVNGIRILKNGEVLFEGGYDGGKYGWYDKNGQWDSGFEVITGQDEAAPAFTGLNERNVVYFAEGPALTARGSWFLYALMVFFTLLVMLDVAFPTALFYMRHCCDVRDPEPSDFYLAMQKVSWVVYPILLLIGYNWALRQFP